MRTSKLIVYQIWRVFTHKR